MLPLFVRCANHAGFGDNQDRWVPNPSATSSLHLSMLSFVGKLMGVAMRGKHILNLDMAPITWKRLVGADVTSADLEDIDALTHSVLQSIRSSAHARRPGTASAGETAAGSGTGETTRPEFMYELEFITTSSDGREVELVPGGKSKRVTWETCLDWADLVEQHKLHEIGGYKIL